MAKFSLSELARFLHYIHPQGNPFFQRPNEPRSTGAERVLGFMAEKAVF
jgi:hypothetical protein